MDIETVINNIENSDYDCYIYRRKRNGGWLWECSISTNQNESSGSVSVSGSGETLGMALFDLFQRIERIEALSDVGSPTDDDIPF